MLAELQPPKPTSGSKWCSGFFVDPGSKPCLSRYARAKMNCRVKRNRCSRSSRPIYRPSIQSLSFSRDAIPHSLCSSPVRDFFPKALGLPAEKGERRRYVPYPIRIVRNDSQPCILKTWPI